MTHSVENLDLSSNRLEKSATPAIRDMMKLSNKLKSINLSCNTFGLEGGKTIYEGVKLSKSVDKVSSR